MKFYLPPIIRFCYRYVLIFILVILPLGLAIHSFWHWSEIDDIVFHFAIGCLLALTGATLIHIGFWEKCFSVLILTDEVILWRCPLRKSRMILLADCVEIGAYTENANNGIPSAQIYFSDHKYPQRDMGKNGVMKASEHLIKFWYSEELYNYLVKNYPSEKTSCLISYRRQRKK